MSDTVLEQFIAIEEKLKSGDIQLEEATAQLKSLDIDDLSLTELERVEDADWIPDEIYVSIFRSWLKNQENNLNQIISYLTLTTSIGKDTMLSFVDSIFKPKNSLSLVIENVIEKIATGGGICKYENPVTLGLVTVSSPVEMAQIAKNKVLNIFSGNNTDGFRSITKPNASFRIDLPPYMRVIPHSYKIECIEGQCGPKTWVLQGSNDGSNFVDIADEANSINLRDKSSTSSFEVTKRATAFRSFQFINKEATWAGNLSLAIGTFDISGEVRLVSNRKYEK